MLEALPREMAKRYESEENLLDGHAYDEEERRLLRRLGATIGGDRREYAAYFRRPDVQPLWSYAAPCEIKGACAFKAVMKRDRVSQ